MAHSKSRTTRKTPPDAVKAWGLWRDDLRARDLARFTIANYRRWFLGFAAYVERPPTGSRRRRAWWEATPGQFADYLGAPVTRGRNKGHARPTASKARIGSTILAAYRWMDEGGVIDHNPLAKIRPPRWPKPQARALEPADVATLLTSIDDERLLVAVSMCYFLGCRVGEVAACRIEDVRVRGASPQIAIRGKGGKGEITRTLPLPEPVRSVLAASMARRPSAGPLLANRRDGYGDQHVTAATVSDMINRKMHALGIAETAHSLRHAFATRLLEEAGEAHLLTVSRMMGHASTRTTEETYLASYKGQAAKVIAMLPDPRHPKAVTTDA
jgi:integrase